MNRKLHNSLLAFSASGLMLVLGLMVASPAPDTTVQASHQAMQSARHLAQALASDEAIGMADARAAAELAARIDARTRTLQAELDQNASFGDTLASVLSFAAEVSTDAALTSAIGEAGAGHVDAVRVRQTEQTRHERRFRSAVAVPYFSFAQRLRGSRS